MGVSLLAPLFLAGLAALAVPIYVHLSERDRRDVVRFPSLRFLTRLPYRQTRRQRLRYRRLFALRAAALVLLVLAFARPLVDAVAAGAAGEDGREVVIALDRSYSMAYGDAWPRALEAARGAGRAAPPGSRLSLVTFDDTAAVVVAATGDHERLDAALATLKPGDGRTRFAPLLRLANEIFLDAPTPERELVLISDFQARAWDRSERIPLVPGSRIVPVDVGAGARPNVLIADVKLRRTRDQGRQALWLTLRLVNRSEARVEALPVEVAAHSDAAGPSEAAADALLASDSVDLPPNGHAILRLGPFEPPATVTRFTARIGGDALAADNTFFLAISPRPAIDVLLIEDPDARDDASLFLRQALSVAEEPSFEILARKLDQVGAADVESAAVILLNDSRWPGGELATTVAERVADGAGLWVLLGRRSGKRDPAAAAWLPGDWRDTVDRLDVQGVSLADVDYDHPIFEIFSGQNNVHVGGPRFYRYRPILVDGTTSLALARYTDGAVALAGGSYGSGRLLFWGSPFDNRWSDLPIRSIFLPFVHQACRWLAGESAADPWQEVGEVLRLRELIEAAADPDAVTTPSGRRLDLGDDMEAAPLLDEAGFYRITTQDGGVSVPVAVNADRTESDLTRLDVDAFVAAATAYDAPAAAGTSPVRALSSRERERMQGAWWYLVLAALLLLVAESVVSNRLPAGAPPASGQD